MERIETGDAVWVLATGNWRRGVVLATLRTRAVVRYGLRDGRTRDQRRTPGFDVVPDCSEEQLQAWMSGPESPVWADRPISAVDRPRLAS